MSIRTIKIENMKDGYCSSDVRIIQIDSEADIPNLPIDCDPGSQAYTPDMSVFCIMGNDGIWIRAI